MNRLLLRLSRARRYVEPTLRHATPRKLANLLAIETEMRLRRTRLSAYPYYCRVDICNLCNLHCRLCPQGLGTLRVKRGMMTLEPYRRILEQVKEHAFVVSTYGLGEPFLNPQLLDMIEHTASLNIGTNLSSNFNWPERVRPADVVQSGLEYVTASLDGITRESYEQYRQGGNFEQAVGNLRALLSARKALKRRTPVVEWQFIVFKHNEHEIPKAQELAGQWGVDVLRFCPPSVGLETLSQDGQWAPFMPSNPLFRDRHPGHIATRGYFYNGPCSDLYRTVNIGPDGAVNPCCLVRDEKDRFGDLASGTLEEIWNNPRFQSGRALFSSRRGGPARCPVRCDSCPMYKKRRRNGATPAPPAAPASPPEPRFQSQASS